MLFDDEFLQQAQGQRASPVARALRSQHARAKDACRQSGDGLPLRRHRATSRLLDPQWYIGASNYHFKMIMRKYNSRIIY